MKFRKSGWLLAFGALLVCSSFSPKVHAISTSSFDPAHIIDDSVFYNSGSMTLAQIQAFLNSKVPVCDTQGTQMLGSQTRAQYGTAHGYPPPYICLKDYYENPTTHANNFSGSIPNGAQSAAQIIYNAATYYGINPQVLIVLLQKEQGLVTDDWPAQYEYTTATGYGCPDSSGCNVAYYGFYNQVNQAAKQFRNYANYPNSYNYVPGPGNYVLYSPAAGCGGSYLNIQNQATASLYDYTPYQPDAAALAAGYGSGDSCSSYGNRNFWLYFNDWFGTTLGTPFFQLPGSVKTYMLGANNTYYYITSPDIMKAYGYGSQFTYVEQEADASYINNMTFKGNLPLIARFEGDGVFAVTDDQVHPFPDANTFSDYGYTFGQEADLPQWVLNYLPQTTPMAHVLKLSDSPTIYYVASGKIQPFCNWAAFTTLGTPVYSSQSSVTLNSLFASALSLGPPLATDGTLIKASDANTYGIWEGSQLLPMNSGIAQATGLTNCAVPLASLQQLTSASTSLSNLAQDSNGSLYIIDANRLLSIPSSAQANLALPLANFIPVDNAFLSRLNPASMSNLFRVNGGDGVSDIINGKAYAVTSPNDLYGLGYSFSQVINVTSSTSNLFPSGGGVYAPGRLARIGNQDAVYLLDNGFIEHPFPSADIFLNYGYAWSNVMSVSSSLLQGYSLGTNVSQYAKDDSGTYWLIDNGTRHKLSTDLVSPSDYNVSSSNSIALPSSVLMGIPIGQDMTQVVRAGNGDGVYLIQNGTKRPYSSPTPFLAQGFTWNEVISLSSSYVNSLPTGAPIN